MRPLERASAPDHVRLLRHGDVEVKGRLPWSSNGTFLVELCLDGDTGLAVYKPVRGERGLWDFPPGLHVRETAAYALSEALGWRLVPETVIRDGPLGEGSLQRFVPADFEQHYFTLHESGAHHPALKAICAFDLLANNADRKSGHCLLGEDGHIWGIDHGLTFHTEHKLRTVIWDFAGEPLPGDLCGDVERALTSLQAGELSHALERLLSPAEVDMLRRRLRGVLDPQWRFPEPTSAWSIPWPPI